jgi:hypothetical protein
MTRYVLPASRLLAGLDSVATPELLLEPLRQLAARGSDVALLVSADRSLVQLLIGGTRRPLDGSARDAALRLLGDEFGPRLTPELRPADPERARGFDASSAMRAATVGALVDESRAHSVSAEPVEAMLDGVRALDSPDAAMTAPLMAEPAADAAGKNLAHAVDSSGLFLEAHLAQWLRGQRSWRQVVDEVRDMPLAAPGSGSDAAGHRGALQLAAQQRQAISMTGDAWRGQSMRIQIEKDPEHQQDPGQLESGGGVFQATLTMDLATLGAMRVRIRVMDHTVGVWIESEQPTALAPQLAQLSSGLTKRGLALAELCVHALDEGAR